MFTVMVSSQNTECCELLTLSLETLEKMSYEFLDSYEQIMEKATVRLQRLLKLKVMAIKHCQDNMKDFDDIDSNSIDIHDQDEHEHNDQPCDGKDCDFDERQEKE